MGSSEVHKLKQLSYFHPDLDRHKAECILLQNGKDGTFLMRNSSNKDEYVVSVRSGEAVKHYQLFWHGDQFEFGHGTYDCVDDLVYHFNNRPLIGGESGHTTVLVEAYPRHVPEPGLYDCVRVHAEDVIGDALSPRAEADFTVCSSRFRSDYTTACINPFNTKYNINSKDGYLTKQGAIFKTWKTRWFVLHNNVLKYFKNSSVKVPLRTLDLHECMECQMDNGENIKDKQFVFRLKFGWRMFYLFASSAEESQEWVRTIQWKLNAQKRDGPIR